MSAAEEKSPLLSTTTEKPSVTFQSRFVQKLAEVTVEPALLLFALAHAIDQVYLTNLIIDKICLVSYQYDAETCTNLDVGNHTEEQDRVQRLASNYNIYRHLAEYTPAGFALLFLGSWGDARGRKLPVLLPFIGCLLTTLCLLANVYWWSLSPPFIILSYVFMGMTGGYLGVSAGIGAYLSATSKSRSMTTKLSSIEGIKCGFYPLGIYIADILYQHGSYMAVYGFQALIYLTAILYLLLRLKEPPAAKVESESGATVGVCQVLASSRLKKTFTVIWRHYEGGGRVYVVSHTIVILLQVVTIVVKNNYFLYTRKLFDWDSTDYSRWIIVDYLSKGLGTLLILPVLSYYWQVDDCVLGFIGGVSSMFYYVIIGTAPAPWVLYLASVIALCSLIPMTTSRGSISKIVGQKDLGAIFALLGEVECVAALVMPTFYSFVYNQTLDIFPGTVFLTVAGFAVLICWINVWLFTRKKPANHAAISNQCNSQCSDQD